jgi:hypothetical protein
VDIGFWWGNLSQMGHLKDLGADGDTYLLTDPWGRVLLENLTGFQLVKKFPHFMEPEGSLPLSRVPDTCPYPEPARSSTYPYIPILADPS